MEAQAPTVQQGWTLLPVNQTGTSDIVQAQDRPQPPQLSPVFQSPYWLHRAVPCSTSSQTTEHLMQSCPIYEPLRKGIWPDHTPVARKLYGSLSDLRCTATFIDETGVSIWRTRRRRELIKADRKFNKLINFKWWHIHAEHGIWKKRFTVKPPEVYEQQGGVKEENSLGLVHSWEFVVHFQSWFKLTES